MQIEAGKTYDCYSYGGCELTLSDDTGEFIDTGRFTNHTKSILIRKSFGDNYVVFDGRIDKFIDSIQVTVDKIDNTYFYMTAPGIIFGSDPNIVRFPNHVYKIEPEDGEYYLPNRHKLTFYKDSTHGFEVLCSNIRVLLLNGRMLPMILQEYTLQMKKLL